MKETLTEIFEVMMVFFIAFIFSVALSGCTRDSSKESNNRSGNRLKEHINLESDHLEKYIDIKINHLKDNITQVDKKLDEF
ncbi:hypothetical protein MDPP_00257, partial [Candidatus Phytoplasma pini]